MFASRFGKGAQPGWVDPADLMPLLHPTLPGADTVIMDNPSSPNRATMRQAIEAVGPRVLFLPPIVPT
jgi:hypothetical protein